MPGFGLVLDPPAVIDRTLLDLNSGSIQTIGGEGHGIDWGESAVKTFLAEQQYGEAGTDFRVPNRIITIPLILLGNSRVPATAIAEQEAARRQLEQKVGTMQREGGVLQRQRAGAEPLYCDIVTASLVVPDIWQGAVEPNVILKLECLPDFYGAEIELDAVEENGQIAAVLKDGGATAVIAGDYPGRARLVLTEKSAHDQRGMLWGFRSRRYDPLPTAALYFDAITLTTINGAVTGVASGAEPSFSGKAVKLASPEVNTWHPFAELTSTTIATGASGSEPKTRHLQHLGTYRVWARINGTAGQRFRLAWGADNATAPTFNPAMELDESGPWQLIDLGEIRLEEPPVGEHWWGGTVQVQTGATAHECTIDRIWLQPLDDGAGKLRATAVPVSTLLGPSKEPATGESNNSLHAGKAWANPTNIQAGQVGSAQVSFSGPAESSAALVAKGMGFALPGGATVKGIVVTLGGVSESGPLSLSLRMLKAGALAGTEKSAAASNGTLTFGSSADLWGTTWTPAQINEATFGVASWLTSFSSGSFAVDTVTIRVFYSIGATTITQDAVLYANRNSEIRGEGSYREDVTAAAYAQVSEQTGDLPRIPPSGMEQRPVQLLIKPSRGLLPEPGSRSAGEADPAIDKLQAQVFYRPCYIGRI